MFVQAFDCQTSADIANHRHLHVAATGYFDNLWSSIKYPETEVQYISKVLSQRAMFGDAMSQA